MEHAAWRISNKKWSERVVKAGTPMTQSTAGPSPGQPSQRVFTGTVTKLKDKFGVIDDDVFFQTSIVKGDLPRIYDLLFLHCQSLGDFDVTNAQNSSSCYPFFTIQLNHGLSTTAIYSTCTMPNK